MNRLTFLHQLSAVLILAMLGAMPARAADATPAEAVPASTAEPGAAPSEPEKPKVRVAIPGNLYASLEAYEPKGIFVEAVDALLKQAGMSPAYLNMPTGEAIREVRKGGVDVATVVVPVPSLQEGVLLSDPLVTEFNVVATLRGKGFELNAMSDLRGKRIAARQGYRYPLLEKDTSLNMTRYRTDGEMIRALLFADADVAIMSGVSDIHAFRAEGIMSRLEVLKSAVGVVPLVAVFSKKRFKAEDIERFNQDLAKFKEGPEWKTILDRNGLADLVHDWPVLKN